MAFIEIRQVSKYYSHQDTPVLDNINFDIEKGRYYCVAGTNGSGKSTLIRMINGLVQPDKGSITVEGLNPQDSHDLVLIRQKIAMVFQAPENQIVSSIVEEDVAFAMENLCWPTERMEEQISTVLDDVHMSEYRKARTDQISAGQQQRVALAGALVINPDCLILDEASSMLNPQARKELLHLLDEYREAGGTIISVTHHLDELLRADQVILIHKGVLQGLFTPRDLLTLPDLDQLPYKTFPWIDRGRALNFKPIPLELKDFSAQLYQKLRQTSFQFPTEEAPSRPLLGVIEGLHYQYPNSEHGIHLDHLSLYKGERLILTGETGAGKSTLLHFLGGVKTSLEGSLVWNDTTMVKGLVMQNPAFQLFKNYVGDDVAFGPSNQGIKGKELALRVRDAMEMAGLPFKLFKDRKVRTLSGGEKRKAAIAGVLALKPDLLLLDEPGAGLDPMAMEEMEAMLDRLQEGGTTLIIATHHMETAARGDRILYLAQGQAQVIKTPQEFFVQNWPALDLPPGAELSNYLRQKGLDLPMIADWKQWDKLLGAEYAY
ncbi:energy-coupling factor transporter ATPase [Spirochaeta cellobiosiphila]|uniref:energy-coupling factor transporter ATPase n=1 Tax=Spirochaeta cellobiosiphila TaxID=504483 RepID=UPI0003FAE008|nr:energy-coupling factor transporter ATPase [Spirochaeta cellobiosiphila]